MPRYPSSVKAEAIRLVKEGATQRTVAKELKVTDATVSRWVNGRGAAAKGAKEVEPTKATVVAPNTPDVLRSIRSILSMASLFDSTKVAVIKALLQ